MKFYTYDIPAKCSINSVIWKKLSTNAFQTAFIWLKILHLHDIIVNQTCSLLAECDATFYRNKRTISMTYVQFVMEWTRQEKEGIWLMAFLNGKSRRLTMALLNWEQILETSEMSLRRLFCYCWVFRNLYTKQHENFSVKIF